MDSPGSVPSVHGLMSFLDEAASKLDSLGKDLEAAHIAMGDAETALEAKMDEALLEIAEDAERAGDRLPGADIRTAKARKRIDFDLYVRAKKSQRLVEGLKARLKAYESAVTARMATLKALQSELTLESRR